MELLWCLLKSAVGGCSLRHQSCNEAGYAATRREGPGSASVYFAAQEYAAIAVVGEAVYLHSTYECPLRGLEGISSHTTNSAQDCN